MRGRSAHHRLECIIVTPGECGLGGTTSGRAPRTPVIYRFRDGIDAEAGGNGSQAFPRRTIESVSDPPNRRTVRERSGSMVQLSAYFESLNLSGYFVRIFELFCGLAY